jgi:hypothetical protein
VENILHLDDVSAEVVNHSDYALRRLSLPRRDGQGWRRSQAALVLALGLFCACSGIWQKPADHAESSPPARAEFPPTTRSTPREAWSEPFVAGAFDLDVVGEASGLALSVRNPGVAYVLDDGPGSTGVLAVDTTTGIATAVTVEGLDGRDTEGLAVGRCAPGEGERQRAGGRGPEGEGERQRAGGRGSPGIPTCLFIGDIGNNQSAWRSVRVWRIREPDLARRASASDVRNGLSEVSVTGDVATYTYPGAPADAEALLVDNGRPFLITKERRDPSSGRTPRPRLLGARRFADGRLHDFGRLRLPAPRTGGWAAALVGNVVTGAELDGDRVVVRTYDHVLIYTPRLEGAPLRTLRRWRPREVATPLLRQGEGVAINRCGIWLISEGVDSIWLVPQHPRPVDNVQEDACPNGSARS